MKKVSVVIPTYNRGHCITKSIESALNQTYSVWEIVIADDGSTDNTEEIVDALNNPLIKYFKLPQNKGASAARNYGVGKSTGEYIAFLDSDDCWAEDKLEKQMDYFEKHPEFGLVYTRYLYHGIDGTESFVPSIDDKSKLEGNVLPYLLMANSVGTPTVLMKRSVFDEVQGFDENMSSLVDWDFAIKVAKKYPLGYLEEPLLNVYQMKGCISESNYNFYVNRCAILGKYMEDYVSFGILDAIMLQILKQAERENVIEPVKKMLMANILDKLS